MGDTPVGRGTPGEAPALASDCHDDLLQADAVHALCQVAVPVCIIACTNGLMDCRLAASALARQRDYAV